MSDAAILATISGLRSLSSYQAAEALRRSTLGGSGAMAKAPKGSDEHRAVVLLISTWETIAVMVGGMKKKDGAFRVLPICHMYRELRDAIKHLGDGVSVAELEDLYVEYEAWLKAKKLSAEYVSAVCGGMHAKFG